MFVLTLFRFLPCSGRNRYCFVPELRNRQHPPGRRQVPVPERMYSKGIPRFLSAVRKRERQRCREGVELTRTGSAVWGWGVQSPARAHPQVPGRGLHLLCFLLGTPPPLRPAPTLTSLSRVKSVDHNHLSAWKTVCTALSVFKGASDNPQQKGLGPTARS